MILGVATSIILLSAAVAFMDLENKPAAIHYMAVGSLLYGVAFAWLESGYLLLRKDSALSVSAVYALFLIIRVSVFIFSGVVGFIFNISDLPLWNFMLISAGISSGPAVMSCLRSNKMNGVAFAYLLGAMSTLTIVYMFDINDAVNLLIVYSLLTLPPVLVLAFLRSGSGSIEVAKILFSKTKSFFFDLPITSIVDNGDRILLSLFADSSVLIAYNSIKVFFGMQREFNKILKQILFHRIFDEVMRGGKSLLIRNYFIILCGIQTIALLVGLILYLYFNTGSPKHEDIYIAICISTAYALMGTHTVAVASALNRTSSLFTQANIISLVAVVTSTSILWIPTNSYASGLEVVYIVSASYLLFYMIKTALLFSVQFRKLMIR